MKKYIPKIGEKFKFQNRLYKRIKFPANLFPKDLCLDESFYRTGKHIAALPLYRRVEPVHKNNNFIKV